MEVRKTKRKISWISIAVIVALAVALATVSFATQSQPKAQAATGSLYVAEYVGDVGTTRLTRDKIAAKYGVNPNEVISISDGLSLYQFLNGASWQNDYKVAYLNKDVAIAYNATKDGYSTVDVNSSAAIFDKILDGNGYTVSIYGGGGVCNSTKEVDDEDEDRFMRRNGASKYTAINIWYEYTGYLVAQNYGTIANMTIDFTSAHTTINAEKGSTGTDAGDLGSGANNRISSNREGLFCAGIVAGINGYGGTIDNIKLNIRNCFTVIKKASNKTGYFQENTAYAGGIAGRIEDESVISNCWVDIASNAGVFAGAEGKPTSFSLTDDHFSLAVAGGLVGNIDYGTAKLNYCVLSGSGPVKAFANRASRDARFQSFSGGVAGGCIYIDGNDSLHDSTEGISVNLGQIKGILSSWTGSRFSNRNNSPTTIMGSIFDSVGTDDVVESVGLLFDIETLMDNNPSSLKPTSSDGKLTLDRSGNLRSWLAIHPTSDGGSMTVEFDTENPTYDIRMQIVADGHDEFKNSGVMDEVQFTGSTRYRQYKLNQGEGGGFIWSGIFTMSNDSSNHINLDLDDPIYAEIYMISSKNSGKYNYEFGKMGQLAYTDTNGSNGNLVRTYTGAGNPLTLPAVTVTNDNAFDTSLFNNTSLWNISRGTSSNVNLTQTYMPGTYTMKLETKLGERTYGYYNEDLRFLAWQPTSDYVFTILQGQLNYGDGTTATDGWQSSVTFELKMSGPNDFDTVEFQRNGAFPSDSSTGFRYTSSGSAFYTVTSGTGKNGMAYTFYAYKRDTISGENVLVAVSESRVLRIDTEAPEVSEIEYYIVESSVERLLDEDELEEIQRNWTKNQVLAKFSVSDNEKSGIASAATETYITDTVLNNAGDRDVVVEINDSNEKILYYIDARGNETAVRLQVNVDRVQGRLSFAGSSYRPEGRFNYSTKNVTVRYVANFGMSGWRLYYSYQKDAAGEDIWIATPDLLTDSGAVKTFTINWNMGNVNTGIGDDFKIKMINEAGLYEEEVFPTDSQGRPLNADNVIGSYVIWLRIANIYLDTNLNHILLEGGEGKSVADILAADEGATYFDKEYDGTNEYEGKKEYRFYTDLSVLNTDGFYFDDNIGVIYSPAGMSRPLINIGNRGIVPVELKYSTSEVGAAKLSFQAKLTGVDGYNYIVYFTDLSAIDFYEDVEVEEGTYFESCEIDVNINKRQVTINLADQEAFNADKHYYYGDAVPTSIEAYVEAIEGYVTVQISTGASASANIGPYTVTGTAVNSVRSNIEYTVTPTEILIEQRPVAVDLRYDGGTVGNVPSSAQSGRTHTITGTYEDVNGDTQTAVVQYTLNGAPINTLGAVGEYTIDISLPNSNYVIDGQTTFMFNILKGYLEITTGVRVKDYTEDEIVYDMIIPAESRELYADSDLKVTYYQYLEGAVYNATAGTITGKVSDIAMNGYPTERGYYYVKVEFATPDSPNFFPKSYPDGYLVITSAQTKVNVEKVALEYSYTAQKFTFDLVDAVAEVRSSSNRQLWSASSPADGIVKVQYKDARGNFVDVAATPNDGGGWYSEVGRYEYRVNYIGNDDYRTSHVDVVMIIKEAELQGITFNPVTVTYDGSKHLPTMGGLLNYTGLKITFQYGTTRINCDGTNASAEIQKLNIASAGQHNVSMTIAKDGYATKVLQATVNIAKAAMIGVSAKVIDVTYDGRRHTVEFLGLDRDESGNYKYKGENVIISAGGTEGSAYATDVFIEPGVGPSYYVGSVTLTSPNYEDLTLNTQITIRQALLPYKEIGKDLPAKLPSAMNLAGYMGYFIDSKDAKVNCALQYTDRDGNVVALDENGTLPDGRYSVMIVIPNSNFYIDKYWNFEIGEINTKEIPTLGYVAIGVVGAVMVAAVVTAIVVVQKRKKAGIV